jgi:hypothetical protein
MGMIACLWPLAVRERMLAALAIAYVVVVLILTGLIYARNVRELRLRVKENDKGKPTIATLKHRAELFAAGGLFSLILSQLKGTCDLQKTLQLGACMDEKVQALIALSGYIFLFMFAAFAVSAKVALAKVEREENPHPTKEDEPEIP